MNPDPETLKRLREFCREELKLYSAEKKRSAAKTSKGAGMASTVSRVPETRGKKSANGKGKRAAVGG